MSIYRSEPPGRVWRGFRLAGATQESVGRRLKFRANQTSASWLLVMAIWRCRSRGGSPKLFGCSVDDLFPTKAKAA